MTMILLLLVVLFALSSSLLWGLLAMASWSDRQMERAGPEVAAGSD